MNKRLKDWIDKYGRRLAELRLAGAEEAFISGTNSFNEAENLSGVEWVEYFSLTGQLTGLVLALEPLTVVRASKFHRELERKIKKMEDRCMRVLEITGKIKIPKGEA